MKNDKAEQPAQPEAYWLISPDGTWYKNPKHPMNKEQPTHVAAVNTSSERVDKTAKNVHEQPAQQQEPVRKVYICTSCEGVYADAPVTKCDCMPDKDEFTEGFIYTSPPAQQQEPVAYVRNLIDPQPHCVTDLKYISVADTNAGVQYTPLYTSPQPSKPWVGLTDQELIDLTAIYSGVPLYCAIEAKLREKNA